MKEQYNDLSLACERIKGEISLLEISRNNAQGQYNNTLATNGQIKMEIAKRDNAQNTYNSMVNHNTATNNQISNMALERDNLQNNYINPYINALQEARNALGAISSESYYYNVTIEKKHTVRGLFGIKLDPKYTYHTERRFNQEGYNNAVGAANTRISNAENQLNVQKANYQGKINTLSTEISSKQSSLYSPVLLEQALKTLNTAKQAVASIGITLEKSEQQVANSLQILKDTSSALKSKQADLAHNEQKKGQVAEKIKAEQLRIQKLEAERLQAEKLELERLEAERIKAEQIKAQKLELESLAIIEEVETTENILGLNENQGFEAEVNIDLSGNII